MNKKQFSYFFKTEIEPSINSSDKPALRQAWNDTIDSMIKNDELPKKAGNWAHPERFLSPSDKPHAARKPYQRKTEDEYQIQAYHYGQWEEVTCESVRSEAKERLKEYRENEPGTAFRIVKKRVPITTNEKSL